MPMCFVTASTPPLVVVSRLRGEHLAEDGQDLLAGLLVDQAEPPGEAGLVHGAELVENDLPPLPLKSARNPRRVRGALRGHRGDDDGPDEAVHLVRRDDEAGAGLLDFTA